MNSLAESLPFGFYVLYQKKKKIQPGKNEALYFLHVKVGLEMWREMKCDAFLSRFSMKISSKK